MTPAQAVAAEQVETNPLYARDVDGDGGHLDGGARAVGPGAAAGYAADSRPE